MPEVITKQIYSLDEIKQKALPLFKRYDVVRAAIFGSYATGDQTEESDIDFLIEFTGRKSLLDLGGLKLNLEEAFCKSVDVITFDSIDPHIRDGVIKEKITIL